jgi:hypothetical protein
MGEGVWLPLLVGITEAAGEGAMVAVVVTPLVGAGRVAVAVTPGEGVAVGVLVGMIVGLGENVAVGDGMAVLVTVGVGLFFSLKEDGLLSALTAWELILTSINDRSSSRKQSIAAMIFAKRDSLCLRQWSPNTPVLLSMLIYLPRRH